MTIPAQRFVSLDKEFNLGIADITTSNPSDILNAGFNTLEKLGEGLLKAVENVTGKVRVPFLGTVQETITDVLNNAEKLSESVSDEIRKIYRIQEQVRQGIDRAKNTSEQFSRDGVFEQIAREVKKTGVFPGVFEALETAERIQKTVREVKGLGRRVLDVSNLSPKELSKLIVSVFPNDPASQTVLQRLGTKTLNRVLSNVTNAAHLPVLTQITSVSGSVEKSAASVGANFTAALPFLTRSIKDYAPTVDDQPLRLRQSVLLATLADDYKLPSVLSFLQNDERYSPDVVENTQKILLEEAVDQGSVERILSLSSVAPGTPYQQRVPGVATTLLRRMTSAALPYSKIEQALTFVDPHWNRNPQTSRVKITASNPVAQSASKIALKSTAIDTDTLSGATLDNLLTPILLSVNLRRPRIV